MRENVKLRNIKWGSTVCGTLKKNKNWDHLLRNWDYSTTAYTVKSQIFFPAICIFL
jgi:hypothetical protein